MGGEARGQGPVPAPLLLGQFTVHIFPELPGGTSFIPPLPSLCPETQIPPGVCDSSLDVLGSIEERKLLGL